MLQITSNRKLTCKLSNRPQGTDTSHLCARNHSLSVLLCARKNGMTTGWASCDVFNFQRFFNIHQFFIGAYCASWLRAKQLTNFRATFAHTHHCNAHTIPHVHISRDSNDVSMQPLKRSRFYPALQPLLLQSCSKTPQLNGFIYFAPATIGISD